MLTLILGGSGSGKSAYAEQYAMEAAGNRIKYYLATMRNPDTDNETRRRIERHQRTRRGKGFITIEQPVSIGGALQRMGTSARDFEAEKTALLECIANLTANEMFLGAAPQSCKTVTDKIIGEIGLLNEALQHLVIVSNNVFEDGICYGESTMEYIRAVGSINERLAGMADKVVEVVAGIPVCIYDAGALNDRKA